MLLERHHSGSDVRPRRRSLHRAAMRLVLNWIGLD